MKQWFRAMLYRFLVVGFILSTSFGLILNSDRVCAQKRVVVITTGQPSVWTLEQASRLLAHVREQVSRQKVNGAQELDPDETNALRLDVLRTLLEFGVTSDDVTEKIPGSAFDDAFREAAKKQLDKFNKEPKLNQELKLENFLQMQYEILAKQLTLLRDEIDPDERLLILELPQYLNVPQRKAKRSRAQSWWKIIGYTKKREARDSRETEPHHNELPSSPLGRGDDTTSASVSSNSDDEYVDLDSYPNLLKNALSEAKLNHGSVQIVKLILPQRTQPALFIKQECCATGFTNGLHEFGWTFTPVPSTKQLPSGTHVTYAVIILPKEASSLRLASNGCHFHPTMPPPANFADTLSRKWNIKGRTSRNCGDNKTFIVPLPE